MSKLGKLFGGGKKPKPLPPLPTREDPAIEAARKAALIQAKTARGRKGSVKTSGSGIEDDDEKINRPGARSAKLLGS